MPNLPWRTERGPILTGCLLKLVVSTGQHLKKNKAGSPDIWDSFSELLFKQPEFHGLEGSSNSIREKYKEVLKERARHQGWMDANGGITGNLSGHEGDLSEVDGMVKQILMDQDGKKAEKELKTIQAGELNDIEGDVLKGRLVEGARKRRKLSSPGSVGSASSTSKASASSTPSSVTVDDMFASVFGPSPLAKTAKVEEATTVEERLNSLFMMRDDVSSEGLGEEVDLSLEGIGSLSEITVPVMISVYCTPDSFGDVNYFKHEMRSYGMSMLDAHKLFVFLRKFAQKKDVEGKSDS
jgi:hypothetical protein